MNTNNLGKTLKKRRRERRLTLKEVNAISGVSISHLGRIERGERFPSAHILKKLAEPLGLGEAELLKLAGYMSQDDSDHHLEEFKRKIKTEIIDTMIALWRRVNEL